MPPITFIESQLADADLVLPVPRRARPGDLLLGVVLTTNAATLTLPEGWASIAYVTAPTNALAAVWLLQYRVGDPEPASHQLAVSAGDAWAAVLLYRGIAEVTAAIAAVAEDQASGTSHKTPSATATTYSDLLLAVWATFDTPTWTAPGDMRQRVNAENPDAGVDARLVIADALREATGSQGGSTATASAPGCTAIACAFMLAANPPPDAATIYRPTPGGIGIAEV